MKNVYYTYSVTALSVSSTPVCTTKETPDPYAVAAGVNGDRSMVCDLDSTNPEGWEKDSHVFVENVSESLVWDLNVKDYSYDASSGISEGNQGKYLAFTESGTTLNGDGKVSTGFDYLKELGVTTVKLSSLYDFNSVDETESDSQYGIGDDPKNFNVPEGSYSSNPYDGNVRIRECKQMIQALHNAGISVVMDVDYTHTFSNDSAFQATVPNYYYRFNKDNKLSDGSGYGNDLATERAMCRNYIIQSLLYWVDEYHIDGFNFNATGLMDVQTVNLLREALDDVDSRIVTWGNEQFPGISYHPEKTCTGDKYYPATSANRDKLNSRFVLFDNNLSAGIKGNESSLKNAGFVQGNESAASLVKSGIPAKTINGTPTQSVSYTASQRELTLYDKLIGSATSDSYGSRNADAVKMNKLAGSIVYMSQGIPFMLAGEEMCRSRNGKVGNQNTADSSVINWENILTYADVVSYYKGLAQIRRNFSPLTGLDSSLFKFNGSVEDSSKQIAYTISNDTPGEWSKMAVLFNSDSSPAKVTLQDTYVTEWVVIANGNSAGVTKLDEVSGSTFTVPACSALIAVEKSSYESVGITENIGKVIVNHIYELDNTKIADSTVLQGTIGTDYRTVPGYGVPKAYFYSYVEGNETGTFAEENAEVTYYYNSVKAIRLGTNGIGDPTVPSSVNDAWKGSYVYFGTYSGNPVKYRVLDSETTVFGGRTMLLDCDRVLEEGRFGDDTNDITNDWANSDIRTYLNGTFLQDNFSTTEKSAIASSTKSAEDIKDGNGSSNLTFTSLSNDSIFLLDSMEATRESYGYSNTGSGAENRKKQAATPCGGCGRLILTLPISPASSICAATSTSTLSPALMLV